jgi:biotin carboxylase
VIYPTIFEDEKLERIHEVAKLAVHALGINIGPAHIELCSTSDGPKLFELGARCGGGGTPDPIVPFLTGIEMFKEVVRIALGEKPQQLIPSYTKGCVYHFITPQPGRVRKITGLEGIRKWNNILDFEVFIGEGDEVQQVKTGGDRAGFIIAGGETREEAVSLTKQAEEQIRFEYF